MDILTSPQLFKTSNISHNQKRLDLPAVNIDLDRLTDFENNLMKSFNDTARKTVNGRVKLDINHKVRCNKPGCLKFASYKYVADDMNICWFHAYQS
jgi:hypothetical protein